MIEALAGIVGGIAMVLFAKFTHSAKWIYALGLFSLPIFYFAFALNTGSVNICLAELLWGLPFIVCGLTGLLLFAHARMLLVIGGLWFTHGCFDLIRGGLIENPGMPVWWPVFCATFDVVVGLYLVNAALRDKKITETSR